MSRKSERREREGLERREILANAAAAASTALMRSALGKQSDDFGDWYNSEWRKALDAVEGALAECLVAAHEIEAALSQARSVGNFALVAQLSKRAQQNSLDTQFHILRYISKYLETRPSGMLSKFRIHLSDSRALLGASSLDEWCRSPYLQHLRRLTKRAAAEFGENGCVTQTFIVWAFEALTNDRRLSSGLWDQCYELMRAGVACRIVTVRYLEAHALPVRNFCVFESGIGLTLDLSRAQVTRLSLEADTWKFLEAHEEIARSQSIDTYALKNGTRLVDFTAEVQIRANSERRRGSIAMKKDIGDRQYGPKVAAMWADKRWISIRERIEAPYLDEWLSHHNIRNGETLLIAACGAGMHATFLAQSGYSVDAFDASEFQIAEARRLQTELGQPKHGNDVNFRTLSYGEFNSVFSGPYDAVFALGGSLIHLTADEVLAAFQNIEKCLKPGGYALIEHRNMSALTCNPGLAIKSFGGIRRKMAIEGEKITFEFIDQARDNVIISGLAHDLELIMSLAARAGLELMSDDMDRVLGGRKDCPEWHSLTFRKPL